MSTESSRDLIGEIVSHHQEVLAESRHLLLDAVGGLRETAGTIAWQQGRYLRQAEEVGLRVGTAVAQEYGYSRRITREGLPNAHVIRESIGWLATCERFVRVYDLEQRYQELTGARQRRGFGPRQMRSFVDGPLEHLGLIAGYGRMRSLDSLEEADWQVVEQHIHGAQFFSGGGWQLIRPSVFRAIIQPQVQQEFLAYNKAFEPYMQPQPRY